MQILCQGNKWKCINSHKTGYLCSFPNSDMENLPEISSVVYRLILPLPNYGNASKKEERAHKNPPRGYAHRHTI